MFMSALPGSCVYALRCVAPVEVRGVGSSGTGVTSGYEQQVPLSAGVRSVHYHHAVLYV